MRNIICYASQKVNSTQAAVLQAVTANYEYRMGCSFLSLEYGLSYLFACLFIDAVYLANFIGKSEGERLLGRLRHRWDDDIKMDLKQIREGVWTGFILLRIWNNSGL
jgi:hypothetical protein